MRWRRSPPPRPLLYLGPAGRRFDQAVARELAALDGFSLLCGRYEGVDERVREHLCDGELSVGDVVLSGGEVAAMVVLEAVARLVPGVMGNGASADDESFSDGLLEYPHYTRPAEFRAGRSPRCCAAATTAGWPAGAGPRPCGARSTAVPTSSLARWPGRHGSAPAGGVRARRRRSSGRRMKSEVSLCRPPGSG